MADFVLKAWIAFFFLALIGLIGFMANVMNDFEKACKAASGHVESRNCYTLTTSQTNCVENVCTTIPVVNTYCDYFCSSSDGTEIKLH